MAEYSKEKHGKTLKQKLIIDVDTGTDDAQAIMLALSQLERVDVLAITCVDGNAPLDMVCKNTLRVLKVCQRTEIPVYKGADSALIKTRKRGVDPHHGADGLGGVPDNDPPNMSLLQKEHAVTAMLRLAREHEGEVTLVCVGPLTNIALAIRMDPEFSSRLKHVLIMGGNIEGRGNVSASAEFNFHCDPDAAFVVLEYSQCPMQILSWEPCLINGIEWDWHDNVLCKIDTPLGIFNHRINEYTTKRKKEIMKLDKYYSCDPMAVAIAIYPEIILKSEKVYCRVELAGEITRGQMVPDWRGKLGRDPNAEVITKVDVEKLKQLYLDMLR